MSWQCILIYGYKYIDANMSEKYMKTAGELPMYTNMSDKYIDAIYQGNI